MNTYRRCAVPMCTSSTKNYPNKLYITVPNNPQRRKRWLQLARRDPKSTSAKSTIFFCEDHFDLRKDMENYIKYTTMGSVCKIRMKPDSLPSRFICQPDRIKRTAPPQPRSVVRKRQHMHIIQEIMSRESEMPSTSGITSNSEPTSTRQVPLPYSSKSQESNKLETYVSIEPKKEPIHLETEYIVPKEEPTDLDPLISLENVDKCKCCLSEMELKTLWDQHEFEGDGEVYGEMLNECFGISFHQPDPSEQICEVCIVRLREALEFKKEILATQEMLQEGVQVVKEDVSNEKQQMEEGPEEVPLTHVSVEFLQKKDEDYDDYIPEVDEIKEITNNKFYKFVRDIQKLLTFTNAIPFRTRATRYYCFYCSTDGPLFEDPDELRSHTTTEHDKERISRVEQHMKPQWLNEVIKFDIKDLQCTECMLTLHDWNNMFVHFAETHDIGFDEAYTRVIPYSLTSDLQCVLCRENFANYGLLDIHMNLHYSNHVCFKCGDTFLSVSRLDKHMTTHKTGNFPCTKCDKSFSLNYYLTRHVNLVHNQKTPKCVYCKKNVEGPMHLHISEEHSEKVKPLTCEVCGKVFTWKPYFVAHMRRNHIGVKKYKCEHCPKKFIKPYELKTHSITHTRLSRLFECGACKATFNSITSIKKHISVHDKEK